MPKHGRDETKSKPQDSSDPADHADIDDLGHTPKWTRSSASASPPPFSAPTKDPANHSKNENDQSMQCILPGHPPLTLASAIEFEIHYSKEHNNQCVGCKANLPSPWTLELHQAENHDPLLAARKEGGEKTYRCFLQECEKITLTPQKRRLHLIDKHGYPRNYDFRIIDIGSGGRRSLLRDQNQRKSGQRRRISDVGKPGWRDREPSKSDQDSRSKTQAMPAHGAEPGVAEKSRSEISSAAHDTSKESSGSTQVSKDDSVDALSTALSSLTFVPLSVRMRNRKKP